MSSISLMGILPSEETSRTVQTAIARPHEGAHRPGPDGDRLDRSNKEYVTKPGSSNRNSEGKGPDLSDRFLARLHLLENFLRAGGIDPPTAGGQLGDDLAKIAFPFLLVRFGGDEIQKFAQQKNQT